MLVKRESLRHPPDFRRQSRRQALDPETYICDNNSEPENIIKSPQNIHFVVFLTWTDHNVT